MAYTVQTEQPGLWYTIYDDDTPIVKVMQRLTGTNRPTGRWCFEILGREGEARKAVRRHYGSARLAWEAAQRQL